MQRTLQAMTCSVHHTALLDIALAPISRSHPIGPCRPLITVPDVQSSLDPPLAALRLAVQESYRRCMTSIIELSKCDARDRGHDACGSGDDEPSAW
jgi:hypothetical protein